MTVARQVHKGFLIRDNKFVAIKKINVFERVRAVYPCKVLHSSRSSYAQGLRPNALHAGWRPVQETRHQMLNDLKALCDGSNNVPGLVSFFGAYHVPESGQISIVLEYVDGGSLQDLAAKVRGGRPQGQSFERSTAKGVCEPRLPTLLDDDCPEV
jgi:hypothetical protein